MNTNIDNDNIDDGQKIDTLQEIDPKTIHSVFAIKDGMFEMVEKTELEKKNYFYRIHSKVPGVVVIDYDKTNIVPIVKDILNRQNTFIEIKYLRWVIGLNIVLILGLIIIGILPSMGKTNFDAPKAEILSEIRKNGVYAVQQEQGSPTIPTISTPTRTSTSTTESPGYNPILPQETTPNNHKNTPSYAN